MNQYTTVGGVTRAHDNNGNLTDDGTYLFGYDYQNRLVELKNKSTSAVIATYRYDALGRRVENAVVGGTTTRYILDGVQVVEEYDGANTWQALYVYEDGIDRPRCMDRRDIADVNGNSNTTEILRFHYHQQALGCVTEITQSTGAVVELVAYDAYGRPTIRDINGNTITQSAVGNPYLYTGREYDPESGLFFYRARYYDPGSGRFLQRDPSGPADGLNLYSYVGSSPANFIDFSGERIAVASETYICPSTGKGEERPASSEKDAVERAAAIAGLAVTWQQRGDIWEANFRRIGCSHRTSGTARNMLEFFERERDVFIIEHGGSASDTGTGPFREESGDWKVKIGGRGWRKAWVLLHELGHEYIGRLTYRAVLRREMERWRNSSDPNKPSEEEARKQAEETANREADEASLDDYDQTEGRLDPVRLERNMQAECGATAPSGQRQDAQGPPGATVRRGKLVRQKKPARQ